MKKNKNDTTTFCKVHTLRDTHLTVGVTQHLNMKTTIHWRTILLKMIGLVLIVFSIVKLTGNPGFFAFSFAIGAIFLLAGKVVIVSIDDKDIRFDRYYLNGTINKSEVIKLEDIVRIEYEEGRTNLEDIFLIGAIPSKNPDKLKIHRKSSETHEYELHFYKSEIRLIIETLNKRVNTFGNIV